MLKKLYIYILLSGMLLMQFTAIGQSKKSKPQDIRLEGESLLIKGTTAYLLEKYKSALQQLNKAKGLIPDEPAVYFRIAQCYVATSNYKQALDQIERAISLSPKSEIYYIEKVKVHQLMNEPNLAIKTYEDLLSHRPKLYDYYLKLAHLQIDLGTEYYNKVVDINQTTDDIGKKEKKEIKIYTNKYKESFEKAIQYYNELEKEKGVTEEIAKGRQWIYITLNENEKAILEIEKLIESNPYNNDYYLDLAKLYFDLKMNDEAIATYEKLLKINASYDEIKFLLYNYYHQIDNSKSKYYLKNAFQSQLIDLRVKSEYFLIELNEVNEVNSFIDSLYVTLLEVHGKEEDFKFISYQYHTKKGEKEKALILLKSLIHENKNDLNLWISIIDAEYTASNYSSMKAYIDSAMEVFPTQAVLWYYKGEADNALKNYEESLTSLKKAKLMAANNIMLKLNVMHLMAEIHHEQKDYRASDELFKQILSLDGNNARALNNFSYFLALRGEELSSAKEMGKKLLGLYPDEPNYLDTYAWVLFKLKEYHEAKKYLKQAIEKSNDGTIFEHMGDIFIMLNEEKEALLYWEKAQKLGNHSLKLNEKIKLKKYIE